jgi:hypothetical protein
MKTKLDDDVLRDIHASILRRGLSVSDFDIEVLEELRSSGAPLFHTGVKFRITYKPTGSTAEYIEGSGHDILDTLCRDLDTNSFP